MPSFQVNPKYAAMSEVVPGLYIAGVPALKREILDKAEISCVINATIEVPNLNLPGIDRMKLWLDDTDDADILSQLEMVTDQIETVRQLGGKVLVHCVAGVSRSSAICLAYLVKYRCRSLRDAYHFLVARRPLVKPNLGFWRQLIAYEKSLKGGRASVRLVETGLLDEEKSQSDEGNNSEGESDAGESADSQSAKRQLVPDVYFPDMVPNRSSDENRENKENQTPILFEGRERHGSGSSLKGKFVPILETLHEHEG